MFAPHITPPPFVSPSDQKMSNSSVSGACIPLNLLLYLIFPRGRYGTQTDFQDTVSSMNTS